MSTGNIDAQALQQLKDAALWFIIISLLGDIGIFYSLGAIISIVGLILLFVMGIPKLRTAFQSFASTGKDVGYGFTGLKILPIAIIVEFVGGLLAVIGFLLATTSSGFVSPTGVGAGLAVAIAGGVIVVIGGIIVVIGGILAFIAGLLIGITLYRLGSFYNNDLFKIGGILEIIPVISFIGWILVYVSIDEIVRRLMGMFVPYGGAPAQPYGPAPGQAPQQYPPQPYQPYPSSQPYGQPMINVYQMGAGVIRPNGEAKFTLYSSGSISIVSATLENTTYTSNMVTPSTLNPGNNDVTVMFPSPSGLMPGGNYNIVLTLSNGQNIKVMVTYQS
ncbi:DUF973 family protein [Stygiolobus caldivivus]|uniref:DUF973 family protein n=1 Tax=Stygiolobus caldivivus TaxID=2824673 RepID=A0A8D5U6K9_9CREN|nr:DUF973 family protein [Stygiolobus caldivivus]BCU69937.1 hypothetical protein KN1_12340 [Stygiolobus caldivivus]